MASTGLFIKSGGVIDLEFQGGRSRTDSGLETLVLISLFTDARATDEELPAGETDKRGWWGDLYSGIDLDKIGSKLWLLKRSKRLPETLRKVEDYIKDALKWMIEDGIAASVSATAYYSSENKSGWEALIQIQEPSGNASRFKVLWDQQKLIRG